MKISSAIRYAFVLCCLAYLPVHAQERSDLFGRKYREGDSYRYRITSTQRYNGSWTATTIATCELTVVKDIKGVYHDMVRWLSLKTYSPKDTLNQTAQLRVLAPYRISLDPKGKLDIPHINMASMTGMITDFNTFFVAISPQLGVTRLKKESDTITNQKMAIGNFSNGKTILQGMDCLQTSARMDMISAGTVTLTTYFLPPGRPCLSYLLPEMHTPVVKDTLNNFQMTVPVGNNRYNLQYGREYFTIRSTVNRTDGKLFNAVMHNSLKLRLKLNCNGILEDCKGELPFSIDRTVSLELLK